MFGISLLRREVPDELIASHQLRGRITRRTKEADEELLFLDQHCVPVLPVWMNGQLQILAWGNRNASSRLPRTTWCSCDSLKESQWESLHPIEACIPASYACDRGVWYLVTEGVRGVIVEERNRQVVYLLSQQATHYYEVMTRNRRMPVFIGETI